jgi:hypothetical protein
MARLRLIDGVQRVSLEDSAKGQLEAKTAGSTVSDGAAAGGSTGDCRGGHAKFPDFNVDVFFTPTATAPAASTTTAAATTPATGASSSTPASTGTPATTSVPSSGGTTP